MKRFLFLFGTLFLYGGIEVPQGFEAAFKQTVSTPKNKKLRYKGIVRFSKAQNRLYWRYDKPGSQEVCSDKVRMVVIDHDLEQASFYRLEKALSLPRILQNAKAYKKGVYVAQVEGKNYTLGLTPQGKLHSVAYFDDLDNKVQIVFSNVRYLSKPLAEKKLRCKIPPHYDRIR